MGDVFQKDQLSTTDIEVPFPPPLLKGKGEGIIAVSVDLRAETRG